MCQIAFLACFHPYLTFKSYSCSSHIYRMMTDYMGWTMDFTAPQMLLTLKLTTMAFDFYDAGQPEEVLEEEVRRFLIVTEIDGIPEEDASRQAGASISA